MVLGVLSLLLMCADLPALLQEPAKPAENELRLEFFSGTVTELSETRVTVLREVLDRDPEERTFVLKPETKIEGLLKGKVRVTVGYSQEEQAYVAVRIIVRAETK